MATATGKINLNPFKNFICHDKITENLYIKLMIIHIIFSVFWFLIGSASGITHLAVSTGIPPDGVYYCEWCVIDDVVGVWVSG